MKIGINLMLFGATPEAWPDDLPRLLSAAGADWIEVPAFDPKPSAFAGIAKCLRDLNLGVSVSSALPAGVSAVADRNAAGRWSDFLSRLADTAHALGADLAIGPLYHPVGEFASGAQADLHARLAQRLAGWRSPAPVRFALEPLNRFETNVLNLCADGARVIDAAGNQAFGLMADTFHMHIEERDPIAAFRELGSRCLHFHASENDRGAIGSGQINWSAWFAAIRARELPVVVAECFSAGLGELAAATRIWRDVAGIPEDCASRSLSFLRNHLTA